MKEKGKREKVKGKGESIKICSVHLQKLQRLFKICGNPFSSADKKTLRQLAEFADKKTLRFCDVTGER
ncbi:hypothetical protein DMA11_00110 [Marinilabiliaceae bacterium JC017]|nr:hypothetical protein DMA11_00110 [Marinilabiliaceae bacterium JC017]